MALIINCPLPSRLSAAADFPKYLAVAIAGLLRGFNDVDSDVRLAADESLNRCINVWAVHMYSIGRHGMRLSNGLSARTLKGRLPY